MTARTVPILQGQSSSSQIADDTVDKFSEARLSWSPDSKQIIASVSAVPAAPNTNPGTTESSGEAAPVPATYYLLKTDGLNDAPQDITATISETIDLWNTQLADREKSRLKSLKPKVADFSKKYFKVISWSPDDKKILYQASESAEMPVFLKPRRIGNNLLYERRDLKKGAIYVYDTTEDINTRVVDTIETEPTFTWFPDSEHLIYVHDKKIQLVDTDGANLTTIYAGPFLGNFVFPWPDGSKLVILTNLGNISASPTLYTIGLK
jgi:Tol biopolymer transport system component